MPPPDRQSVVATRLRVLRAHHPELSQTALAELVGVSQHAVSRWEMGKSEPRAAEMSRLCDAYGVSADYLLGRTNSTTGLEPGRWIVDLDAVERHERGEHWAVEIPRRHKVVDHREKERIRESRKKA